MENPKKSNTPFFREEKRQGDLMRIIIFSLLFHAGVAALAGCALLIRPPKKPHEVPIVELVNPPRPKRVPTPKPQPVVQPKSKPEPEPVKPEVVKELPPEIKPEKPIEKPKEKKKEPVVKPQQEASPKKEPPQKVELPKQDSVVKEADDWGDEEIVSRTFEPTVAEKQAISTYRNRVAALLKMRFSPIDGQRDHYGKYCTIEFKVYRNGALIDVELVRSSGESFIDNAALAAFKKGKVEQLPNEFNGQYMPIAIDFKYTEIE